MGVHFDECPRTLQTHVLRLQPAAALTHANIPCLVWAEDALSFVHLVPTELFALQLLVPDDKLEEAAAIITSAMPFERMSSPPEHWLEWKLVDPRRPHASLIHCTSKARFPTMCGTTMILGHIPPSPVIFLY
ncbi:hypothetical protein B0H10DRAFT_2358890 [Mycena sp. CBHHK59/15]|nr:hypothetical protein B0H10DRAFT_2358890 [Mycena sp. CBHHK59/15]